MIDRIIENLDNNKYPKEDLYTTHIKYEIDKLQVKAEQFTRSHVNRIKEVVMLYDSADQMKPIVIVYNGTIPIKLIDGNHTLQARLEMGITYTPVVKIPIEEFGGDEQMIEHLAARLNSPHWVSQSMDDGAVKRMIGLEIDRSGVDYVRSEVYRDKMAMTLGRAKKAITTMTETVIDNRNSARLLPAVETNELSSYAIGLATEATGVTISTSEKVHTQGIGSALHEMIQGGYEDMILLVYYSKWKFVGGTQYATAEKIIKDLQLPITLMMLPKHEELRK